MPTWLIAGALAAAALVVLGRALHRRGTFAALARRHLPRLRNRALGLPPVLREPLLFLTDRLFYTWRTYVGGSGRTPEGTDLRLVQLRATAGRAPIVLLGGVYLDVTIRPVDVQKLQPEELSTLGQVLTRAGGSAVHVGRRLYDRFSKRSTLITRLGGGAGVEDTFSKQLRRVLRTEAWHRSLRLCESARNEQCGVSIHLQQRDGSWRTTFTHPGSLRGLTWHPGLRKKIQRRTKTGGILYISGYFRTNLCQDLTENLSFLSPRVLVCLDHGEFQAEDNAEAVRRLIEAFASWHVDVYICTFPELVRLCNALMIPMFDTPAPGEVLQRLHTEGKAPSIVIVRGGTPDGTVWVMHHGEISPVDAVVPGQGPSRSRQESRGSTFTADFMGSLLSGHSPVPDNASHVLMDAVMRAMEPWREP